MNTRETRLRRDAFNIEEVALDEESTATRVSLRDSESLEDSDKQEFSQSELVGFFEKALEQADRTEPRRGTRAKNVPQFFGEVKIYLAVTDDDYAKGKTVYEVKQGDDWDQWRRAMKSERGQGTALQRDPSETTKKQGRHTGQMGVQSEIGTK